MNQVRTYKADPIAAGQPRAIIETSTLADGSEAGLLAVRLPAGTHAGVVTDVVAALSRAYQAGRDDALAGLLAGAMAGASVTDRYPHGTPRPGEG